MSYLVLYSGYVGYFAPKPTSACLEVTNGTSADGCAFFAKSSRLRVVSCESKTLALSIGESSSNSGSNRNGSSSMVAVVAIVVVVEVVVVEVVVVEGIVVEVVVVVVVGSW